MLIPCRDVLVIRRKPVPETTAGGIIIPDAHTPKPTEGLVIAAGKGAFNKLGQRMEMEIKAGDTVLFDERTGIEVTVDGEKLLVMKAGDVIGVLRA